MAAVRGRGAFRLRTSRGTAVKLLEAPRSLVQALYFQAFGLADPWLRFVKEGVPLLCDHASAGQGKVAGAAVAGRAGGWG